MKVAPWVKWYAGDFLHGVVELGPQEGWVYTVILNLIYDFGGPIPDNVNRLARRCNMRPTSVEKALIHLVESGKLNRGDGMISNARAEKEMKSRQEVGEKSAHSVSVRWQKVREKPNDNNAAPIRTHNERNTPAIPTRSQKPDNTLVGSPTMEPAAPDRFEEFWQAYPARLGDNPKKPAREKFAAAVKRGADPDRIIAAARALAARCPTREKHTPMAASWLHQERYADEGAIPAASAAAVADWPRRLRYARLHRSWAMREWGPMPGTAGCLVPADLIEPGDGDGWIAQREAA